MFQMFTYLADLVQLAAPTQPITLRLEDAPTVTKLKANTDYEIILSKGRDFVPSLDNEM